MDEPEKIDNFLTASSIYRAYKPRTDVIEPWGVTPKENGNYFLYGLLAGRYGLRLPHFNLDLGIHRVDWFSEDEAEQSSPVPSGEPTTIPGNAPSGPPVDPPVDSEDGIDIPGGYEPDQDPVNP